MSFLTKDIYIQTEDSSKYLYLEEEIMNELKIKMQSYDYQYFYKCELYINLNSNQHPLNHSFLLLSDKNKILGQRNYSTNISKDDILRDIYGLPFPFQLKWLYENQVFQTFGLDF